MSALFIISCIGVYFLFLLGIAWYTSRNANSNDYFLGSKASPWYAVAFGMIGDSLSGVTFISVPGAVGTAHFSYMQLVLGYLLGYYIIAKVLLPIYYNLNLTSIYSYLEQRFGTVSQKTGSFFFLISRLLGAGGRLFLAVAVIQLFVFDKFGVPFTLSVILIITLILIYTYKGGIKTLVWTDTFQSTFLVLAVVCSIWAIANSLNLGFSDVIKTVRESELSNVFVWDFKAKNYFWKHFLGGAFIAIAMTGLDQNMMQKNLSCKSLSDAQKNIQWFSVVLVFVNLFFVSLGALLYFYANKMNISIPINEVTGKPITDYLFPTLALNHLGMFAGIVFIIGLTAATFSSADSVLTSLTTSFYIDFLNYDRDNSITEELKSRRRTAIHIGFAILLLLVIIVFKMLNNQAIIDTVLTIAGYTYGPLLGMFAFGLFTKTKVNDKLVPFVCVLSPLITFAISSYSDVLFNGYKIGFELLILNGLLTFFGLWLIKLKRQRAI